jgi:hypothetical protein
MLLDNIAIAMEPHARSDVPNDQVKQMGGDI